LHLIPDKARGTRQKRGGEREDAQGTMQELDKTQGIETLSINRKEGKGFRKGPFSKTQRLSIFYRKRLLYFMLQNRFHFAYFVQMLSSLSCSSFSVYWIRN